MTPVHVPEPRARSDANPGVASRLVTLAVAIALAGCSPAPALSPSVGAPSAAPPSAGASPPAASFPAAAEPALAAELRDAVDPGAILADLQRLQDIADANGGNRAAGSESEAATEAYVADQLRAAGFAVEMQAVSVPWFHQDAPSVLDVDGLAARWRTVGTSGRCSSPPVAM